MDTRHREIDPATGKVVATERKRAGGARTMEPKGGREAKPLRDKTLVASQQQELAYLAGEFQRISANFDQLVEDVGELGARLEALVSSLKISDNPVKKQDEDG